MATKYVGGTILAVTEISEILESAIRQTKWNEGTIPAVTEIPEISLIGLNTYTTGILNSNTSLSATAFRIRTRGGAIAAISEIPEGSRVAVLPQAFASAGRLFYDGSDFKGKTIPKGSYLPLVFEISGDRLTDMDVIFEAQTTKREPIFTKRVKLGVLDRGIKTLPDGRDSISGEIIISPSDTQNIPAGGNQTEVRYNLRLANNNVRNYFLESGIFIVTNI